MPQNLSKTLLIQYLSTKRLVLNVHSASVRALEGEGFEGGENHRSRFWICWSGSRSMPGRTGPFRGLRRQRPGPCGAVASGRSTDSRAVPAGTLDAAPGKPAGVL